MKKSSLVISSVIALSLLIGINTHTAFETAEKIPQPWLNSEQIAEKIPQPWFNSRQVAEKIPQPWFNSRQVAEKIPQPWFSITYKA